MLDELPFELLSHIYSYLDTAQSVSHVSSTCRRLHNFSTKEGWKIFLRTRFPSLPTPALPNDYREAAHGLTTLSRNWDRKGFVARYLEPAGSITSLPTWEQVPRWQHPDGQTIGYQPCIDSYEDWTSGDWSSRKQVLTWCAGTELLVRAKNTGRDIQEFYDTASPDDRNFYFDQYKHLAAWFRYGIPGGMEGRDDITSLHLIRPYQKAPGAEHIESIVFATADGVLQRLNIGLNGGRTSSIQSYTTDGIMIHCTSLSPSISPLLAADSGVSGIALYPMHQENQTESLSAFSQIDILPEVVTLKGFSIWGLNFLSEDKLGVGVGPSTEPFRILEVSPAGLVKDPIRSYQFERPEDSHRLDGPPGAPVEVSTYSVIPLPPSSQGGRSSGEVFLTGDNSGTIRLHDLRSPSSSECSYWDTANDSTIYALQTQGRERIVAGTGRHTTVMVYDLRVSGGRAYHNIEVPPSTQRHYNTRHPRATKPKVEKKSDAHYNWNVFLNPRGVNQFRAQHGRRSHNNRYERDSPVYTLSLPSPSSPTLFAGVEDAVIQLDFTGILDAHPDPVFASTIERTQRGEISVKKSWNPRGDVMNFGMYDKTDENALGMNLWVQAGVGLYKGTATGLDDRWRDPSQVDPLPQRSNRSDTTSGTWRGE
ncbi:uncharacterized protein BDZ99DRAFT_496630 [Mytilinidion resinicola]|uniref:F-box domain-containing protein n=1 Tax=Mytilinidion resinicola TaxID=574789 RepID=A0A6A6YVV9_9PEZI|nr:uncharacterized protein BDZ99DRAFT_496630 [Mytilinidion resinicola]KAF2812115.1 hypothetical protein BDZ99DRAFT_496630 [Mytilinidion resinicola]